MNSGNIHDHFSSFKSLAQALGIEPSFDLGKHLLDRFKINIYQPDVYNMLQDLRLDLQNISGLPGEAGIVLFAVLFEVVPVRLTMTYNIVSAYKAALRTAALVNRYQDDGLEPLKDKVLRLLKTLCDEQNVQPNFGINVLKVFSPLQQVRLLAALSVTMKEGAFAWLINKVFPGLPSQVYRFYESRLKTWNDKLIAFCEVLERKGLMDEFNEILAAELSKYQVKYFLDQDSP